MTNKIFNRAALATAKARKTTMYVLCKSKFEYPVLDNTGVAGESLARLRHVACVQSVGLGDHDELDALLAETEIPTNEFITYVKGPIGENPYLRIVQADNFVADDTWRIDFIAFPNPDYRFLQRADINLI